MQLCGLVTNYVFILLAEVITVTSRQHDNGRDDDDDAYGDDLAH